MEVESGVTRSIIDELLSTDIQRDQMEGKSGVTRKVIHEVNSSEIQKIKRKLKVVLLELKFINFLFGYPRRSNGR